MIKKFKDHSLTFGLIFTIASAIICMAFTWVFFMDGVFDRMKEYLFDCGMDVMGTFVCAALFFGTMKQEGDEANAFRTMDVFVCAGFLVNALMYYTTNVPGQGSVNFFFVLLSKLIDLVLIYYFYKYIKVSLGIEGKLSRWADKGIPIMLGLETLVILSNIFHPVTFRVSERGIYQALPSSMTEDIYLIVVSVLTTVMIIKSNSPRNQKLAALTFIFLPLFNYLTTLGEFGNASNYGMILLSLIIMYCLIFNYNSSKLASTQTELNMATEIQAGMLPSIFPAFPNREEFDLYASMDPAREVGGDFYDFYLVDNDHLALICADVSGKGVPAALFMMISKTIIQNFAMLGLGAAETLNKANEALCVRNTMEMFVTAWIGILEISTGKLTCANAGHEYPAVYRDGRFELFKDKHGLVLGGMDISRYKEYEITLNKGDKIFVYTDGVPEATSEETELFGTDRMLDALNNRAEGDPKEILETVRASVDSFVGPAEQFDDLTMLCLEYKGAV